MAGIVVEPPVEQYLLLVHEEHEGVLSEQERNAMQRSTGAPHAPNFGLTLCRPNAHCLNPLLNSMRVYVRMCPGSSSRFVFIFILTF